MSYKHNILKERFDIEVTASGETFKGEWELDRHADVVFGVAVTSDSEEMVYYRGSQKMQVNDRELFPEDFESKLLMSGLSVAPNQRMAKVGNVETGNKRVEVWYKDQNHPKAPFSPYRVSFYFFSRVKPD
jgi:hypothetical protein